MDENGKPREPIIFDAEEELLKRRNDRARKASARTTTVCLLSLAGGLILAGALSYYIGDRSMLPAEYVLAKTKSETAAVIDVSAPTPKPLPTLAPVPSPTPVPIAYEKTRIRIDGAAYAILASREAAEELLSEVEDYFESQINETGELVSEIVQTITLEAVPEDDDTPLDSVEELLSKFTSSTSPLTVKTKLSYTYTSETEPETEKENDKYLLIGTRVVVSLGRKGRTRTTVSGEYLNGVLQGKTELSEETLIEAQPFTVRVGTMKLSSVKEPGRSEGKKGKKADGLKFKKPVSGTVSSNFGQRRGEAHLGLDYTVSEGDSVKASADGEVVCIMERGGYGLLLEIDHGQGFVTRYAHLSEVKVKLGDVVSQGDEVALAGTSGKAEGLKPVLHFELLIDGEAYNPRYYIN